MASSGERKQIKDPELVGQRLKFFHEYTERGVRVARITKLMRRFFAYTIAKDENILQGDWKFKAVTQEFKKVCQLLEDIKDNKKTFTEAEFKSEEFKELQSLLEKDFLKKIQRFKEIGSFTDDTDIAVLQDCRSSLQFVQRGLLLAGVDVAKRWYLDEKMRAKVLTFGDYLSIIQKWVKSTGTNPFTGILNSSEIAKIEVMLREGTIYSKTCMSLFLWFECKM